MKRLFFSRAMLKVRKPAWLLTLLAVLSVCALAIVRSNSSAILPTPKQSDVAASAMVATAVSQNQAPPGVLMVSLLPTGFEPSELTHPAGKILLGVNNRTGLSDLRFQLTDENGRPVGEKRMVKEKIWRKVIEPKPGRYMLRVLGHPSWFCDVIITPQ
jgi:hypothetical protein